MSSYFLYDAKKQNMTGICIGNRTAQGERQNKMDNLLGPDSNIFEKCHLVQPRLRLVSGKATAKWKQKSLNHAPGGEINEGQSEVRLNPPSCYRGGYRSAKQNERLTRSLHCQCCNVRKATQCHLKPTGTAPALEGKQQWPSWGRDACKQRTDPATHASGSICVSKAGSAEHPGRTSSQTLRNITEPHLCTPGGRLRPFLLGILLWVSQGREDSSKLAVRQRLCL